MRWLTPTLAITLLLAILGGFGRFVQVESRQSQLEKEVQQDAERSQEIIAGIREDIEDMKRRESDRRVWEARMEASVARIETKVDDVRNKIVTP